MISANTIIIRITNIVAMIVFAFIIIIAIMNTILISVLIIIVATIAAPNPVNLATSLQVCCSHKGGGSQKHACNVFSCKDITRHDSFETPSHM